MNSFREQVSLKFARLLGRKYMRKGRCAGCGSCCTNISIKDGRKVVSSVEQFELLQQKYPEYRMFKVLSVEDDVLTFKCLFLDEESGRCTNYKHRPPICRNYPNEIIFKLGGTLAETCGFEFEPVKKFDAFLEEAMKKHDVG